MANFINTNLFILVLQRFIARSGNVIFMRPDNGSNLDRLRQAKLFLEIHGADWIVWERNPPAASHMGGVWER